MTRVVANICGAVGAVLALLSIFVLPWASYGDIAISLSRFAGWPVYAVSALALQAVVAWALWAPDRWPRARLAVGLACGLVAVASAIVLGLRYDNSGDLFEGTVPLAVPSAGSGPFVAVLAVLISLFTAGSAPRSGASSGPAPQ